MHVPRPPPPTPIYSETSGPDPDRERLLRVWGNGGATDLNPWVCADALQCKSHL